MRFPCDAAWPPILAATVHSVAVPSPRASGHEAGPAAIGRTVSQRFEDLLGILAEEIALGFEAGNVPINSRAADPRVAEQRSVVRARFDVIQATLTVGTLRTSPADLDRESFRRVRDELHPAWESALLALDPAEVTTATGRRLFREVRDGWKQHVHFPEEWEYDLATLYVFQSTIADFLPAYFYALIDGTKGAGKTTFLDHVSLLTGALRLQSFTLATLTRSMTKFRPVSIDEFDITEKNPELGSAIGALVRQGYKRDAAPRKVCAPRSNEVLDLEIAGPKAITFRGDLDDALKDRGFPFPMAEGASFRLVVLGMAPEWGDLPARLRAWGKAVRGEWSLERVYRRIKEPSFETAVRKVLGKPGATRGAELTTIAILVSEIVAIDLTDPLKAANAARERDAATPGGVEELMDALRALTAAGGPTLGPSEFVVVPQKAVRAEIDRRRRELRQLPTRGGEFAQLRKDALIRDDWRVTIHGYAYWKIPRAFLRETPGSESPDPPESPARQDDRVARVGRVIPREGLCQPDAADSPAEPLSWQEPAFSPVGPRDEREAAP